MAAVLACVGVLVSCIAAFIMRPAWNSGWRLSIADGGNAFKFPELKRWMTAAAVLGCISSGVSIGASLLWELGSAEFTIGRQVLACLLFLPALSWLYLAVKSYLGVLREARDQKITRDFNVRIMGREYVEAKEKSDAEEYRLTMGDSLMPNGLHKETYKRLIELNKKMWLSSIFVALLPPASVITTIIL